MPIKRYESIEKRFEEDVCVCNVDVWKNNVGAGWTGRAFHQGVRNPMLECLGNFHYHLRSKTELMAGHHPSDIKRVDVL